MAVGFDAATESHTGTTGASGDFTFTHTPGTPGGILVFLINREGGSTGSLATCTVTWGGVSIPEVQMSQANDTTAGTEGGFCKAYFLGIASTISGRSGDTVSCLEGSSAWASAYAVAITVTSAGNTEVYIPGIVLLEGDNTIAEQSVTDNSPGTNSMRFAAVASGLGTPPAQGASSTQLHTIDFTAFGNSVCRETTAGQGSRSVGFSSGTSDDRAAVHLAVRESPAAVPLPILVQSSPAQRFRAYR